MGSHSNCKYCGSNMQFVSNIPYADAVSAKYENLVAYCASQAMKEQGYERIQGRIVSVECKFYMPIPESRICKNPQHNRGGEPSAVLDYIPVIESVAREIPEDQCQDAHSFHAAFAESLKKLGWEIECEYPIQYRDRNGRVDIFVSSPFDFGIELDRCSPREKSIEKLERLGGGFVVMRSSKVVRYIPPNPIPPPSSARVCKKLHEGEPHGQRPDLDNLLKSLDGLNGVVWSDDCLVYGLEAMKLWSHNPRTEIRVT